MSTLFNVELDLHVVYQPPMSDKDIGIVITRSFQLPFAPIVGLKAFSRVWEDYPEPGGFTLEDVVWDVDRSVFLTSAHHVNVDFPVSQIPGAIRHLLGRGWDWGSYVDRYRADDASRAPKRRGVKTVADPMADMDPDLAERLHTLPPEQRPAEFNTFFKALIGHMVHNRDNLETAYAMDMTGRYLGDGRVQSQDEDAVSTWHRYEFNFHGLTTDDRVKWMDKTSRYPALSRVVLGPHW